MVSGKRLGSYLAKIDFTILFGPVWGPGRTDWEGGHIGTTALWFVPQGQSIGGQTAHELKYLLTQHEWERKNTSFFQD